MDIATLEKAITSLGFPTVCVIALGWFAWHMVKKMTEASEEKFDQVYKQCVDREKLLYEQIAKGQQINGQFAEIIAKHETILESMKKDLSDVKEDVLVIKTKL